MKITITLELTPPSALGQTSLKPMPSHDPATGQLLRALEAVAAPLRALAPADSPLPFAESIQPQTSAGSSREEAWLQSSVRAKTQCQPRSLLDQPQLTPQELDCLHRILSQSPPEVEPLASGGLVPPPPHAPVGSSAFPEPNPGDFRFKANLESLFALLRRLP